MKNNLNKQQEIIKLCKKMIEESLLEVNLIKNLEDLKFFKNKHLNKSVSTFSFFLSNIKNFEKTDNKSELGFLTNNWKKNIIQKIEMLEEKFSSKSKINKSKDKDLKKNDKFFNFEIGSLHPIKKSLFEIYNFFTLRGYRIFENEEIESQWYNFDSLNISKDHPSRSHSDTFYVSEDSEILLRTHSSSCQARVMEKNVNKSIMVVCGGKVYRNDDDDLTHSHQYTNLEIIKIGGEISFANLKWTLEEFFNWFFEISELNLKLRFRPSFFPFTEPSFEVDLSCFACEKKEKEFLCNLCKSTRWIEVLGAGLIHPKVLKNAGYDNIKFSGFAIGVGVERMLMIKHGIKDIREFYSNDPRFLKQIN